MARAVFVGQFAMTVLVTLLVYAEIQPIKDALQDELIHLVPSRGMSEVERNAIHRDILDRFPFFAGRFRDLSPQWYGRVGVALFITVLCNLALPFVSMVFGVLNRLSSSCWCCLRGSYTRRSLTRSLQAPCFELGARYGVMLNFTFTSLLLASGMPALWLVAALLFLITYMVDKIVLLRLSRTPVNYSRTISDECIGWFKYAAVLHMAMSVWTFSATNINAGGPSFPRLLPFVRTRVSNCSAFTDAAICGQSSDCIWRAPAVNRRASAPAAPSSITTSRRLLQQPNETQSANMSALSNGANVTRNAIFSNVSVANTSNTSRTHTTTATPKPTAGALAADASLSTQEPRATVLAEDGGGPCQVRDLSIIYSFAERVFNVITFPTVAVCSLVILHCTLKFTPLWPTVRRMYQACIPFLDSEEDLDEVQPSYANSVEHQRFGNFPIDYDLSRVGRYHEFLDVGDNLRLFRKVYPHPDRIFAQGKQRAGVEA